ncbi:alpha/beta fold hydrolase [Undibacterium sp. RuRC25W]|uniref:alpha/beta hydrolase family protein n=1 Tax=Undibacterium sp. RuRC25W TaxID=3413047 RepID=UPI003BF0E954
MSRRFIYLSKNLSNMNTAAQEPDRIEINCADGVSLVAHFFRRSVESTELPVLICPATGVKQHFYFRFASWLSEQGHDVLVFDYRGIGLSLRGELKRSQASLEDWGCQDQVAALECLLARTASEQVVLLGHSAGGQMMGLMPNHAKIARVVGVSVSTGWFSRMRWAFSIKARFGLRLFVPIGIKLLGYGPTAVIGLGENLPSRVALQWGEWCAAGGYATNAIRGRSEMDFHRDVGMPIIAFYAEDDDIANAKTVDNLMSTFPSAEKQVHCVRPAQFGLKSLGHIDWFRRSHQAVWPLLVQAIKSA